MISQVSQINKVTVWVGILLAGVTIFLCALTGGCRAQVGPFVPPNAKICSWEGECPKNYTCQFPRVDSRAVCMPGENRLDAWPSPPTPEPFR